VNRGAEQVVVFSHRIAGVDPDPDPEILGRFGVVGGEPPLNISGGTDRVCHLVEHRHDAVARVLHLAPAMRGKPAAYEAIMHPHELKCGDVAETGRQLGRTDDVGDQDGAQSCIHVWRRGFCGVPRIADAPEERLHSREIDANDLRGDLAVRFAMDLLRGGRVGCLDQAEARTAFRVVPVGEVLDSVLVLNFQVLPVRFRDMFGCHSVQVMAVHEDRHDGSDVRALRALV
jgi:hypothetical protein